MLRRDIKCKSVGVFLGHFLNKYSVIDFATVKLTTRPIGYGILFGLHCASQDVGCTRRVHYEFKFLRDSKPGIPQNAERACSWHDISCISA